MSKARKSFQQTDIETASRLFNAGKHTHPQIAAIIGCQERSVTNLKSRMGVTSHESIKYEPYAPAKRGRKKLPDEALEPLRERLLELISDNPQVTYVEMQEELQLNEYKLKRLIKIARISKKRAHRKPTTRNSPQLLLDRRNFAISLMNIPQERRIYLDETGFNLHTYDNFGWAPMNMVPVIPVNPNKGRNCTLIMAISQFGIEGYTVFSGACNARLLSGFVIQCLNPIFQDRPSLLMMDNARFHHSAIVRQSLTPEIEIKFLPAYSPQLNPIEQVFSLVKYFYKRQRVKNAEEVVTAVKRAVQAIQVRENLLPFYREQEKWLQKAFRSENFDE